VIDAIAQHRLTEPSTAAQVNQSLNLNLGLPLDPTNPPLRKALKLITDSGWIFEKISIAIWLRIPLYVRHKFAAISWIIYSAIHKKLIGRNSAIHHDATLEYHAMTTAMYWGSFFPLTVQRMRLALNQIQVNHPPSRDLIKNNMTIIKKESTQRGVAGAYLHLQKKLNLDDPPRVILWYFGGAYLSGDVEGNIGIAEKVGRQCNADVFVANYRLLPEHEFWDALDDVLNAYLYLVDERKIPPKSICLYGISSGGGLAVKMIQRLIEENKQNLLPAGAVLMCPFVDYTEPRGSTKEYVKHDLIVNQSVFETGIPYLEIKLGSTENRIKASPVHGSFHGFPPICIVVSEHEICFDQCMLLAKRALDAQVNCTVGIWKYMCHTFPVLSPFIPEGEQAQNFMCKWMRSLFESA